MREEFAIYGYKVASKPPSKKTWPDIGMSNEKSKKLLGLHYGKDIKQSIIDTIYSAIENGILENEML